MFSSYTLAREFKAGLDSGKAPRRRQTSKTVAEYYTDWLSSYRGRTWRGVEAQTRSNYEGSFRLHILPLPVARIRLRDLGAPDLRDWFEKLELRGRSPRTIKHAKIALSVMLACAVEDGDIPANPAMGVRYVPSEAVKVRHTKLEPLELTADEVKSILGAMSDVWRAFFFVLAQTGVRISEMLGLTWGHVHLGDDPHIMVEEQVYRGRRKGPKWDSKGKVPLSPTAAAWLAELRPRDADAHAPVFPSAMGTPFSYANVYNRVFRPALIAAGIAVKVGEDEKGKPKYDYRTNGRAFHAFRHACQSYLHAAHRTGAQSAAWLRHKDMPTNWGYTHAVDPGSADIFDDLYLEGARGNVGATGHPQAPATGGPATPAQSASESQSGG
jgi:integrase